MTIDNSPPEVPREEPPGQAFTINPISQLLAAAGSHTQELGSNLGAAFMYGGLAQEAAKQAARTFSPVYERTVAKINDLIQQLQVKEALEGPFLEVYTEANACAMAFGSGAHTQPNEAEALWQARLTDHTLVQSIAINGVSSGIGIGITPRIATTLPFDNTSRKEGYVNAFTGNFMQLDTTSDSASSAVLYPAPIFARHIPEATLKPAFSGAFDEAHQKAVAAELAVEYRKFGHVAPPEKVDVLDAIAVIPAVESIGLLACIDYVAKIGAPAYPDKPNFSHVIAIHNGVRVRHQTFTALTGEYIVGSKQDLPFTMPSYETVFPRPPRRPFSREAADALLTLCILPVEEPLQDKTRPQLYGKMQKAALPALDGKFPCTIANIAIVGAY